MFSMKKHDSDELQQIGCTRSDLEIRYVHSEAYTGIQLPKKIYKYKSFNVNKRSRRNKSYGL